MNSSLQTTRKPASLWLLAPLFGTLLYAGLYLLATFLYPGGSQHDQRAKGFSWMHNYWCNLLNETAINGEVNTARPVAMTALLVLCGTLMSFWIIFPLYVPFSKRTRLIFQLAGVASMLTGVFLSTALHDLIINVSTLLGLVALTGTFIGLYKLCWPFLFRMGLFTLVLIGLNNLLYYKAGLLYYLPVVQKLTFAYVLLWICLIDLRLYRSQKM